MDVKAVIFDVDGTLWDSTHRIAQSYMETIQRLGIESVPITQAVIESFMGLVREDIASVVFPNYAKEEQLRYIDICMEEECAYLKVHAGILYEGVEEVLDELCKRYELYIVSNCQDGYIETLFSSYPLQQYIKDYECSGRTGLKKGDNIAMLMKRNFVDTAIYVGDTIKDKEASEDASIPFIYANYGFGEIEGYEPEISSFKDLLNVL